MNNIGQLECGHYLDYHLIITNQQFSYNICIILWPYIILVPLVGT